MSNSNKVTVDNLSSAIMKALTEYKSDIDDDVKDLSDKNTKQARDELKSISPKAKKKVYLRRFSSGDSDIQFPGSYAKSWSMKNGDKAKDVYSKVVYNRKYYRLTHLLEFGHATRNGGHTKAIPHIRKTEDKYREKFKQELEQRIRR